MNNEEFQIDETRKKIDNLKSGFIFLIVTLLFFLICYSIAEQQKHSMGGLEGIGSGLGFIIFAFIGIINLSISLHYFLKSLIKKSINISGKIFFGVIIIVLSACLILITGNIFLANWILFGSGIILIAIDLFRRKAIKKENKQQIISKFSEKPRTKVTWYAMYFGLAAFLIPIILNPIVLFIKDEIELPDSFIYILSGFNFTILIIGLIISIIAFIKGERSWVMWVGLISCILMIPSLLLFFIFLPILK
jgi:hypothetical protein